MTPTICAPSLREVVERLAASANPVVGLTPGSGLSLIDDWWTASLPALGIEHTDYGSDAALIGLVSKVRAEVKERLADPAPDEDLTLLLRLWLASEDGRLGTLLNQSARLIDWDYEEMWLADLRYRVDAHLEAHPASSLSKSFVTTCTPFCKVGRALPPGLREL
jgi:hypothetical protein